VRPLAARRTTDHQKRNPSSIRWISAPSHGVNELGSTKGYRNRASSSLTPSRVADNIVLSAYAQSRCISMPLESERTFVGSVVARLERGSVQLVADFGDTPYSVP